VARGGTRKARAAQADARRKKEQKQRRQVEGRVKAEKASGPKPGKGRAFLLHIAGIPAPFVVAYGLLLSGNVSREGEPLPPDGHWLSGLMSDPNASFFQEPAGFIVFAMVWALALALFIVTPVLVWKRVYRGWEIVRRDRSAVDNSFTLLAVGLLLWLYRMVAGYTPVAFHGLVQLLIIITVYIPLFSGVLGLVMPVVPGSGRIGGILPDFMKIPFTEKMLLSEPEQAEARAAAELAKEARVREYEEAREARAARKRRKREKREK
jgi:hypothetical protein